MTLWCYGILLPENEECSISSMLNLITDELTQNLETYDIITIKDNVIVCVINKAGYDRNYN